MSATTHFNCTRNHNINERRDSEMAGEVEDNGMCVRNDEDVNPWYAAHETNQRANKRSTSEKGEAGGRMEGSESTQHGTIGEQ